MGLFKSLFKQTAIYGLATVLPRMFSFILVPLYTSLLPKEEYGQITVIFSYMIFFNVILAYGMETSFFRFYTKEDNKNSVVETSTVSIFWSTILFLTLGLIFKSQLSEWSGIGAQYVTYAIWILALDAFVIIPFSKLRAQGKSGKYAIIKILNVVIMLAFNVFFLTILPEINERNPSSFHTNLDREYLCSNFYRVYFSSPKLKEERLRFQA